MPKNKPFSKQVYDIVETIEKKLWEGDFHNLAIESPEYHLKKINKLIFSDEKEGNKSKKLLVKLTKFFLESNINFKFKTMKDTEELLFYNSDKGIWEFKGELVINFISDKINNFLTTSQINEIVEKIKRKTYELRSNFNKRDFLAIQNGVLNLDTLEIEPKSPDFLLTRYIDIEFNPDIECPIIDRFLGEICPEKRHIVEEMMAYCLEPHYNHHKIFMLVGDGANGKSTLLELLTKFLGSSNTSHIPMQAFEKSDFSAQALYGKMANIFADLPSKALYSTGIIKTLSGGDTISCDVKNKDRIEFINIAKLIYSMNKLPMVKFDDTLALWRRFIVIKFTREFLGNKADKHLIDKLTTPEELSGLLNLLLIALKRLRNRDYFKGDETIKEARKDYILSSDSVHSFALWGIEDKEGNRLTNLELFEGYLEFCEFHQIEPQHQQTLTKNLPIHKSNIKRWKGKKGRGYKGIEIKEDFTIILDDELGGTAKTRKTASVHSSSNEIPSNNEVRNPVFAVNAVHLSNKNPKNLITEGKNQIFANLIQKELLSEENEPLTRIQLIKLVNIDNEFNNDDISESIDDLYSEGRLFSPKDNYYSWVK